MKKNMFYTAAVLLAGAVMAACSGSEDMTSDNAAEPQKPAQQGVVELSGTIGGKGNLTRTIASDGKGSWAVGDQFAIYYQTTSGHSTAVATINSVNDNGAANFKVSLYYPKTGESNVTLIYPASAHNGNGGIKANALAEQDGTLATISERFDIETATTGLNVEDQADKPAKATLNSDVQMQPQVCLYTLNLKKNANTNLSATKLEISDGTHSYTVNPTGGTPANSFTVALLPASGADFTFAATTTEEGLVYTKLDNVTVANCDAQHVGCVFDKDGNVYSASNGPGVIYGASFSNKTLVSGNFYTSNLTLAAGAGGGITPVALIAYVGTAGDVETSTSVDANASTYKGLAIAMNDCSSSNTGTGNWSGTDPYTPWCSQNSATCTPTENVKSNVADARGLLNGIAMTSTLASATDHTHWAAKSAANYQYDTSNPSAALPSDCSGWFLPSLGQWQLIIQGLVSKKDGTPYSTAIEHNTANSKMQSSYFNSILTNAGAALLSTFYLSCSEYSSGYAWHVYFGTGYAQSSNKTGKRHVRAVLAF